MDMPKNCGNPWNDTRASHTFFSQTAMGEFGSASTHLLCIVPSFRFFGNSAFHHAIHLKGVPFHQHSSAVTACIQANISPPLLSPLASKLTSHPCQYQAKTSPEASRTSGSVATGTVEAADGAAVEWAAGVLGAAAGCGNRD